MSTQTEFQYNVIVKNGNEEKKYGFFYPASKFSVLFDGRHIDVEFKQNPKQTAVVYELSENNSVLERLTHPDYVPELSLGKYKPINELNSKDLPLYAALVYLGVSKDSAYKDYFLKENISKYNFEIRQDHVS